MLKITKMISKFNFYPGTTSRIKYIVIHYVGATGSAKQNCEYYAAANRGASAHYFIDHNGDIYQSVEDANSAWHCGGQTYKHKECRNTNSIGIELCCRTTGDVSKADKNWYFENKTVESAIELTKQLMKTYNIPAEHVIRHYDVTGKICPAPYVFNTGKHTWDDFQKAIGEENNSTIEIQNESKKQESYSDQDMWNDLKAAGFPDVSIAAWLGNIKAESGLKSNNLQNSFESKLNMTDETYTNMVDNKTYSKERFISDKAGYGLCQWTFITRKKNMYQFIIETLGKSIGDGKAQIDFLLWELSISYRDLVTKLKNSKTVKEASDLILTQFEKPADQSETVKQLRSKYSQEFYDKFAKGADKKDNILQSPFIVKVNIPDLNIRKGPGTNYAKTNTVTGIGSFTIVEVQSGIGSEKGWGLLKSGQVDRDRWISLDFVEV